MAFKKNILLVGSNDRASLACARSLANKYYVHIARFTVSKNVACYSNTVTDSHYVGNPEECLSEVTGNIEAINLNTKFDFILPITDEALIVVERLRERDFLNCKFLIPNTTQLDTAQDKFLIKEFCEDIEELYYPETMLLTNDLFDANHKYEVTDFPVYLKTRKSSFVVDDYIVSYSVKKINNTIELNNYLRDVLAHVDVLVQKTVEGKGVGLNVFSISGDVVAQSVNERVHEPRGGGGGVFRKTRKPSLTESNIISKIVRKLNWTGPLMIELKRNNRGWCLIELNCRFWGSLTGTIFSGHNYPLIHTCFFDDDKDNITALPEAKTVTSRNLLKDIAWTLKNKKPLELFKILLSPIDVFTGKDIYDVERLNDIKPAFFQFLVKFNQYAFITKLKKVAFLAAYSSELFKIKSIKSDDISKRISIICRGNVNRSAFAAHYFFKMANITIESQSTIRMEKRKVSLLAYETAIKLFDIDMDKHRSTSVFGKLNDYDIFLCMDFRNVFELLEMGVAKDKVRLFPSGEVKDPHGGEDMEFEQCFKLIASEINGLIK